LYAGFCGADVVVRAVEVQGIVALALGSDATT